MPKITFYSSRWTGMFPLLLFFFFVGGVRGKDLAGRESRDMLKGIVLTKEGKRPVKSALVYITKGEEETLTNEKGEFVINCSRAAPFELYIENEDFKPLRVLINNTSDKLNIFLEAK